MENVDSSESRFNKKFQFELEMERIRSDFKLELEREKNKFQMALAEKQAEIEKEKSKFQITRAEMQAITERANAQSLALSRREWDILEEKRRISWREMDRKEERHKKRILLFKYSILICVILFLLFLVFWVLFPLIK